MTPNPPIGVWKPVAGVDPHCFACGKDNPHGLRMTFETDGERFRSRLTVPRHLRGWDSLVHGGVLATILDEAMSWAAIHLHRRFILTKSMEVRFRKPVRIETELTVYSQVLERRSERQVTMQADILDAEGDICATSTGAFVLFTAEQFGELDLMERKQLSEMADWLE
ncbi:PaaI family thioesterase [Desulfobotulus sp.]|uniref:PaaI family thioesterase n=1 Tax=Desulfobotulus sp. TaxID=1940337 RepID=UPI002A36A209|nr:PaaI family thioesterase [Desulfobotulus sp.]MDY0161900.1 PaaI family thioesterase [Desulfobotulus sp.]